MGRLHDFLKREIKTSDEKRERNNKRLGLVFYKKGYGCGYTRCLVHHPGKPLFCPHVSMLRIDTRIQQAVLSLKSDIVLRRPLSNKTCNPVRVINMRLAHGGPNDSRFGLDRFISSICKRSLRPFFQNFLFVLSLSANVSDKSKPLFQDYPSSRKCGGNAIRSF